MASRVLLVLLIVAVCPMALADPVAAPHTAAVAGAQPEIIDDFAPYVGLALHGGGGQVLTGGSTVVGGGGAVFAALPILDVALLRLDIGVTPHSYMQFFGYALLRSHAELIAALAPRFGTFRPFFGGGMSAGMGLYQAEDATVPLPIPDAGVVVRTGVDWQFHDFALASASASLPIVAPAFSLSNIAVFPSLSLGLAWVF